MNVSRRNRCGATEPAITRRPQSYPLIPKHVLSPKIRNIEEVRLLGMGKRFTAPPVEAAMNLFPYNS